MPLTRPDRLPRPLRLTIYGLATLVLLYLCLAPVEGLPSTGVSDKIEHALAWAALTLLGLMLAPRRRWAIPAFAVLLGAAVEGVQATMGFGRQGDWLDLACDTGGVALAVVVVGLWRRRARS